MIIDSIQAQDFSERETEIIELIAEGLTNREIADRVCLSRNTIKWYIQQLNQKLYTENRDEIVDVAHNLGLLNIDSIGINGRPHDNLPQQTTPFIGRNAELAELQTIFEKPETRLLTILGLGGMGKTRIALRLLEEQMENFSDGVYVISLQSLTQVEHIMPQIATSIGYQVSTDSTPLNQQLLHYLSNKNLLLLLDNFEHLLDGIDIIHKILKVAPRVKIVVTSREKLNLLSETVYTLAGLSYAHLDSHDDAIKFLVQNAQRVNPNWTINSENKEAIARLCHLTEGMPLGLLLSVAWLDVYSLEQVCVEIQKNSDILASTKHDIPTRQRSIRAIFEYSWQELTEEEKNIYMKMSVFQGGCSLEALEHVSGATAPILQKLINKALISRNRDGNYSLHELLRQYANEYLEQSDLATSVRTKHMNYYAKELEQHTEQLKDSRQLKSVRYIKSNFENVRTMWYHMIEHQHFGILNDVLVTLRVFSLLTTGMDNWALWLSSAINTLDDAHDNRILKTQLRIYYADAIIELSQIQPAYQILKDCEPFFDALPDKSTVALGLISLSRTSFIVGEQDDALAYAETFLPLVTELGDDWHIAQAHFAYCLLTNHQATEIPLGHVEQSLAVASKVGDRYWMASASVLCGLMYFRIGQFDKSRDATKKGYQYSRELGNKFGMTRALNNLAETMKVVGDWKACEDLYNEAIHITEDLGYSHGYLWVLNTLAQVYLIQGNVTLAEETAKKTLVVNKHVDYPAVSMLYLTTMSMIAEYRGDFEEAHTLALKAYDYVKVGLNWAGRYRGNERLAWSYSCNDEYDAALEYLTKIAVQDLEMRNTWHMLKDIALVSMMLVHKGRLDKAVELLSLIHHHDIQAELLTQHPKLRELRQTIQKSLDKETYDRAWQNGKSLDLSVILETSLAELSN